MGKFIDQGRRFIQVMGLVLVGTFLEHCCWDGVDWPSQERARLVRSFLAKYFPVTAPGYPSARRCGD